jgi:hypothetical protein
VRFLSFCGFLWGYLGNSILGLFVNKMPFEWRFIIESFDESDVVFDSATIIVALVSFKSFRGLVTFLELSVLIIIFR